MNNDLPFWHYKKLDELTAIEWESLCDGCGRCCMTKLEDEDSGEIFMTSVACRLLDRKSCRCKDYENRNSIVKDCIKLTLNTLRNAPWLPYSCAYRQLHEGRPLEWWHPLLSGSHDTIHQAGISVQGIAQVSEDELNSEDDYLNYIIGPNF